jgi:hypothetical protein
VPYLFLFSSVISACPASFVSSFPDRWSPIAGRHPRFLISDH